jgi:hypothetical protein
VRTDGSPEEPIITIGDCINEIRPLLAGQSSYGAADVIAHLRAGITVDNRGATAGE